MSALSDASIIRGDDPESERHVYKRMLELLEPDEDGLYPNPRAEGCFWVSSLRTRIDVSVIAKSLLRARIDVRAIANYI